MERSSYDCCFRKCMQQMHLFSAKTFCFSILHSPLKKDISGLSCKQTTRQCRVSFCLTRSHCLSLLSRIMTSLGCIWYPSSLNDRLRPSNVTFIRYLQRETRREGIEKQKLSMTCLKVCLSVAIYICPIFSKDV